MKRLRTCTVARSFTVAGILLFVLALLLTAEASAIEIPLEKRGGVYTLPVRINGAITLPFILDSGASEVVIPVDVVLTLIRTGTIKRSDFLPGKTFTLADGTQLKSPRFIIRELELGGIKIFNVPASVAPPAGDLLLGQSLLERLASWTLDNKRHVLIVSGGSKAPPNSPNSKVGLATPNVPPPPPKRITSVQPQVSRIDKMRSFILDCLRANEMKDINRVLSFYADKVNYLGKGVVSKAYIKKDKKTFFTFCHSLSYSLDNDLSIEHSNNPAISTLTFTFTYYIDTLNKFIVAKVKNVWNIENLTDNPKIVAEKQTVISRYVFVISHAMQNTLGHFTFTAKNTAQDNTTSYDIVLRSAGHTLFHDTIYYTKPYVYYIDNMPTRKCQSAITYIFSGGAHCCTTYILAIKCGQQEHAFSIDLLDSVRDNIQYLDLNKNNHCQISIYDWSFAYYTIDNEHSLCFACSPAFRRLIIFDGTTLRPDVPGEFAQFYATLFNQTENELYRMKRQANYNDYDIVALAITKAYYSLMSGNSESQCKAMLYEDLPYTWQSVRSRVFTDVKKAVLSFDPVKTLE